MFSITSPSTIVLALVVLLAYMFAVKKCRFEFRDRIAATVTTYDILALNYFHEFPFLCETALQLGFLKTYAIPSISKILLSTGQLQKVTAKRIDDTDLLMRETTEQRFGSNRFEAAINRINEMHSKYNIKNEDFLYVLCLFMTDPLTFQERFGYRKPIENEYRAYHAFWKDYGVRMGIKEIPESFNECLAYMEEFELKHMVFNKANYALANGTLRFFVGLYFPPFAYPLILPFVSSLLSVRLRRAIGISDPPLLVEKFVNLAALVASLFTKYFLFPRRRPYRRTVDEKLSNGNYCPYYHPYGNLYPQGYKIEELGPAKFRTNK
jgi:hypothetical protein